MIMGICSLVIVVMTRTSVRLHIKVSMSGTQSIICF